jgi:hypothetical protein
MRSDDADTDVGQLLQEAEVYLGRGRHDRADQPASRAIGLDPQARYASGIPLARNL